MSKQTREVLSLVLVLILFGIAISGCLWVSSLNHGPAPTPFDPNAPTQVPSPTPPPHEQTDHPDRLICDRINGVGAFVYSWRETAGLLDYATGFGYAVSITMTDEQYAKECGR